MSDQWLSIVEYARRFNISDMTVRRRIKTGKLQAVLREGKYFIPSMELVGEPYQPEAPKRAPSPQTTDMPRHQPLVKPHHPNRMNPPVHQYVQPSVRVDLSPPATVVPPAPAVAPSYIPSSLTSHFETNHSAAADAATLLAFCEGAMKKISESERRLEGQHQEAKLHLESEIRAKDLEISQLSQQVEDLQVLVKILEKKGSKL